MSVAEEAIKKGQTREIVIKLEEQKRQMVVRSSGKTVRILDMKLVSTGASKKVTIIMSEDKGHRLLLVRVPKEYDLVRETTVTCSEFCIPIYSIM